MFSMQNALLWLSKAPPSKATVLYCTIQMLTLVSYFCIVSPHQTDQHCLIEITFKANVTVHLIIFGGSVASMK